MVELQQVSDELAARERNPALAVADDDLALEQEQVPEDPGYSWKHQPSQEVDQDRGMEH